MSSRHAPHALPRKAASLLTAISLAVTLVPATFASALAGAAPVTVAADAFENDDAPATARDVTALFSYYGKAPTVEAHTFDSVDDATAAGDEDWFKFTISDADIESTFSYLIEAIPTDDANVLRVDPVIEIYGPGTPASWTAPADLAPSAENTATTETDPLAIAASDDSPWAEGRAASIGFWPEDAQPGVYYVRVRPFYQHAEGPEPGFRSGAGSYSLRFKIGLMTRAAGADRYATAASLSAERFRRSEATAAVVASGASFADALAGSTLAGALGGPMLLTAQAALSPAAENEIVRLGVTDVYLLGGPGAVSAAVETRLGQLVGADGVHRVAGGTRIETAIEVAKAAQSQGSAVTTAFICNGWDFPDALSASPMATYNAAPILLSLPGELPWQTEAAIRDLGITDVIIVGGTGAVSSAVQTRLVSLLGGDASRVRRIAGANRYETSSEFAIWATEGGSGDGVVGTEGSPFALKALQYSRIGIASGQNYPDALAGGVFCGLAGAPVLLTPSTQWSSWIFDYDTAELPNPPRTYYGASQLAILRSYVFGGTGALSDWVHLSGDLLTGPGIY